MDFDSIEMLRISKLAIISRPSDHRTSLMCLKEALFTSFDLRHPKSTFAEGDFPFTMFSFSFISSIADLMPGKQINWL